VFFEVFLVQIRRQIFGKYISKFVFKTNFFSSENAFRSKFKTRAKNEYRGERVRGWEEKIWNKGPCLKLLNPGVEKNSEWLLPNSLSPSPRKWPPPGTHILYDLSLFSVTPHFPKQKGISKMDALTNLTLTLFCFFCLGV
jgi:hypothetical protein